MLRRYKFLWALSILAVLLVAVRAALPSFVKDYVNRRLQALEAYDGHVADVDLALWRGAYRIDGIKIVKTGAKVDTPFFTGDRVDFSIEWRSLLRGSLVSEGVFYRPSVNLIGSKNEQESQTGKEVNWPDELEELAPYRVNTVRVVDGSVTFRAPAIRSEDALTATQVIGEINNITNVAGSADETFAGFNVTAVVLGDGSADVSGRVNPLAPQPTFDVNVTVKNVQLPRVNPWLREYIKADAESGEFELYTELAAADGKFTGYAKPIMRNVIMYRTGEPAENPLKRLWEGLVDFAAEILEDGGSDQVAARIPFSGRIEDPDADIFATVISVLRNAFISAFARSLEGSITLRDVKKKLTKIGDDEPETGQQDRGTDDRSP